jgi:hypothetical protein
MDTVQIAGYIPSVSYLVFLVQVERPRGLALDLVVACFVLAPHKLDMKQESYISSHLSYSP